MKTPNDQYYMGQVRIGPKGQIVIPKEVREMFGIETGDALMIFADKNRGIAIEKASVLSRIADAVFSGKRERIPDSYSEANEDFAEAICDAQNEAQEEGDAL